MNRRFVIVFILLVMMFVPLAAFAEGDDEGWVAGAIQSEAYSQPFEAQCGIARIVWEESLRRKISVAELVQGTNYLSGWKYGGWHTEQYLNPLPQYRTVARIAKNRNCANFDSRWFDGKYNGDCLHNPIWDVNKKVELLYESGDTCFYGYHSESSNQGTVRTTGRLSPLSYGIWPACEEETTYGKRAGKACRSAESNGGIGGATWYLGMMP